MRALFLITLTTLFFLSCEKTDPNSGVDDPDQEDILDYFPLSIGSTWVYQNVDIDSDGQERIRAETDSILISRDTLINDMLYYVFEGRSYPFNGGDWGVIDILRDSSGYIVNTFGEVEFSLRNFSDTLHLERQMHGDEILFTLSYRMENENESVSVPAGVFNVLDFKGTVTSEKEMEGIPNPRYIHNLYAIGAGKVLKTYFYFSSSGHSEKRLLRYTIQD